MNHHTESRSWQEKTSRLHVADGSLRNRAQGHQKRHQDGVRQGSILLLQVANLGYRSAKLQIGNE